MTKGWAAAVGLSVSEAGESLSCLRLSEPSAQRAMERSLGLEGQLTPLVCYYTAEGLEVIDGFKRLRAVRKLGRPQVWAEVLEVDAAGAKLLVLKANAGRAVTDLEQAWVVRALYRQDKITQGQIGSLLGRDKSWVSRRLLLAEGLCGEVEAQVRLGLITASVAREIGRLPRGNQVQAAEIVCRRGLTSRQAWRLVTALLDAEDDPARQRVLKGEAGRSKAGGRARPASAAEQLIREVSGITRLSVRLSTRLIGRTLAHLDEGSSELLGHQLVELDGVLLALSRTIQQATAETRHGERS
jgi:ParB-like chromosome segregation protein Spo0J